MFKVEIKGGDGVRRDLQRLREAGADLTTVMRKIAGTLYDETMANFDAQGRPTGWPALAESTLKRRPHRRGGMILQDKGRLRGSISEAHGADYAEVGSNLVYARIHDLGGQAGRNHATTIPARPFFMISDEGWDTIHDIIGDHFEQAVG